LGDTQRAHPLVRSAGGGGGGGEAVRGGGDPAGRRLRRRWTGGVHTTEPGGRIVWDTLGNGVPAKSRRRPPPPPPGSHGSGTRENTRHVVIEGVPNVTEKDNAAASRGGGQIPINGGSVAAIEFTLTFPSDGGSRALLAALDRTPSRVLVHLRAFKLNQNRPFQISVSALAFPPVGLILDSTAFEKVTPNKKN